jgi:hypothetical protein
MKESTVADYIKHCNNNEIFQQKYQLLYQYESTFTSASPNSVLSLAMCVGHRIED